MAVAPDAIDLVESAGRGRRPRRPPTSPSPSWPRPPSRHRDWAGVLDAARERFPDLWQPGRRDLCFATTNRQSALDGDRRPLRRHRGDRLGQLLQHPGPGAAGPRGRLRPGLPGQRRRRAARRPHRHRRRHRRRVGPRGAGRRRASPASPPTDGVEEVRVTDEDEYFPPPRELRELLVVDRGRRRRRVRRAQWPSPARPATASGRQRRPRRPRLNSALRALRAGLLPELVGAAEGQLVQLENRLVGQVGLELSHGGRASRRQRGPGPRRRGAGARPGAAR